jgi:hypothetical protein
MADSVHMSGFLSCGQRGGTTSEDIDAVTCRSCLEMQGQRVETALRMRDNMVKAQARLQLSDREFEKALTTIRKKEREALMQEWRHPRKRLRRARR